MLPERWVKFGVLVAGLYLLSKATAIYLPIILAIILAFVLNPVVNLLCSMSFGPKKQACSRPVAILLGFLFASLALTLVGAYILLPFTHEFAKLADSLPVLLSKIRTLTSTIEYRANMAEVPDNVRGLIDEGLARAVAFSVELARRAVNAVIGFAGQVVELIVVPVLAYYFLKDWRELKSMAVDLFPAGKRDQATAVIEEIGAVVSKYVRGQVLLSIIMGFIIFGGMYLLGLDYPLVLGLLAGLTEFIPIIGPIIGAIPAVLLAYATEPALALKVLIFYFLAQQLENHIILPKIMGQTIELHPVFVIVSLLIGGQLYGIVGMMLAVPVAAILRVLLKHLWYYGEG
ncbi:AI-2E family transporter [Sporolituus thermophilus]|uniref:Predicted PurR-regulated permease PerM n=1 Tax=Sporolituus thermophilus DSM 23256 TaxID=1123285 RepID=A0A1G7IDZ6_9FIRM|nr:AI-2E family transporter [Sporolituus thermophilus]SDF10932.1 Predicted PurR-regulated permease PerM [Sporolituus thermophilus DSM 23256]